MSETWKWKSLGVFLILILSAYLLTPSILTHFAVLNSSTEKAWWAKVLPSKGLNLGLDLRGGLYLELDADLKTAIKNRIDVLVLQMEQQFSSDKYPGISFESNPEKKQISVQISAQNKKALLDVMKDNYVDIFKLDSRQISIESVGAGVEKITLELMDSYVSYLEETTIKQAQEAVRNRVDRYGVSEASVQRQGSSHIIVEIPGVKDPDRVIDIIRKTGQLEFRLLDDSPVAATLDGLVKETRDQAKAGEGFSGEIVQKINEGLKGKIPEDAEVLFELQRDPVTKQVIDGVPYLVKKRTDVTGDMLKNAQVNVVNNEPRVSLAFDKVGSKNFAEVTSKNVGRRLAIILDGQVSSAPRIDEAIPSGQAEIRLGMGDYQALIREAEDLALVLREGALPTSLAIATKNLVGPSLGEDSIRQGLRALLIASLVVVVFMILYYKWGGVIANVALLINIVMLFAVMAFLQASLSLPGMAGIVLTIGMAVDANIIIFERMKEEKRLGKTAKAIVDSGYANAMSAIIDSNLTTLISGIVLYQFGTGPIKGFATTLMIGILTTMFSAIVVTRLIYDYFIYQRKINHVSI